MDNHDKEHVYYKKTNRYINKRLITWNLITLVFILSMYYLAAKGVKLGKFDGTCGIDLIFTILIIVPFMVLVSYYMKMEVDRKTKGIAGMDKSKYIETEEGNKKLDNKINKRLMTIGVVKLLLYVIIGLIMASTTNSPVYRGTIINEINSLYVAILPILWVIASIGVIYISMMYKELEYGGE